MPDNNANQAIAQPAVPSAARQKAETSDGVPSTPDSFLTLGSARHSEDGDKAHSDNDVATEVLAISTNEAAAAALADRPVYSPARKRIAIAGLTISLLLVALDLSVITNAVPTIAKELNGFDTYSWIGSGYMLTATALGPLWGKVADIFGRKAVMQVGCFIFLAFSIMCALAPTMEILIIGRTLKGIGGGAVQSLMFVLVAEVVSMEERAKWQGIMMAVVGLGIVAGPVIGGSFTSKISWRWCFWINVPLVAASMVLQQLSIIPTGIRSSMASKLARIDWGGSALCIAGSTLVLLGLTFSSDGWATGKTIGTLVSGAVVLALFVVYEIKVPAEPAVPMRLFKSRGFTFAALATLCTGWVMMGSAFFLPLYYQLVRGATPIEAAVMFLPFGCLMFAASLVTGALSSKTGRYLEFPRIGFAMLTIALALTTALFTYDMHIGVIYAIGCIMGFFFGMGHTMLMVVVQVNADVKDLAPATAVSYFIRSLGSTMAVAVLGAILNSAVPTIFVTFMPNLMSLGITPAAAKAYIEAATSGTPMPTLTPQQSAALAEATARTFGQALRWCFLALVPAALIGFICLMIVPFKPLHSAKSSAAAIESSSDDEEVDIKGDVTEMKKIDV